MLPSALMLLPPWLLVGKVILNVPPEMLMSVSPLMAVQYDGTFWPLMVSKTVLPDETIVKSPSVMVMVRFDLMPFDTSPEWFRMKVPPLMVSSLSALIHLASFPVMLMSMVPPLTIKVLSIEMALMLSLLLVIVMLPP